MNTLRQILYVSVFAKLLMTMLPGRQYRNYYKIVAGMIVLVMLTSYTKQAIHDIKLSENSDGFMSNKKLNCKETDFQKYAEISDILALSTIEKEIKTKLNKITYNSNIVINAVKIKVSGDDSTLGTEQITQVHIMYSQHVDKMGLTCEQIENCSRMDKLSENSDITTIKTTTANLLGIEEERVLIIEEPIESKVEDVS